jgi:hypothetical protein
MKYRNIVSVAAAVAALVACAAGCTANASVSAGLSPPAGCSTDSSLVCSAGAVGWTCSAGDNPELETSGLSCSIPVANGPNDDFCCFDWTFGSTCTPDDTITSVCQPGSFGYSCAAGDSPNSLDSRLNCSTPTANGPNDEFCCN